MISSPPRRREGRLVTLLMVWCVATAVAAGCGGVRTPNVGKSASGSATPTSTGTPKSTPTATPSPNGSPTPTGTATPTPTPTATPTPTPTATPTPIPTATPTPTPTPFTFPANVADFEQEIVAYETKDTIKPPLKGQVVFIGSSSILSWGTLATDFPKVTSINRGFGGSTMAQAAWYAPRIVIPYEPKTVVLYEGDNDLAGKATPEYVLSALKEFVRRVHAALPATRIIILSIKPSIARWDIHGQMETTNRLMQDYVTTGGEPNLIFVDAYNDFLGPDGKPRPELYTDGLHLTKAGYKIWVDHLQPYLQEP